MRDSNSHELIRYTVSASHQRGVGRIAVQPPLPPRLLSAVQESFPQLSYDPQRQPKQESILQADLSALSRADRDVWEEYMLLDVDQCLRAAIKSA